MVGEVVLTACHVLNRVPTKNSEITPYGGWKGRKPSLHYLHAWSCLAMISVPINNNASLDLKQLIVSFWAMHTVGSLLLRRRYSRQKHLRQDNIKEGVT
jgi:hypothetical protein